MGLAINQKIHNRISMKIKYGAIKPKNPLTHIKEEGVKKRGYKNKRDTNRFKKRKTFFPKFLALDFFAMRIGIVKTIYFLGAKLLFNKANS